MIHLPPEPAPGDKVSANAFRQLIRAVKSLRPIAGTGVRLSYGPNGTVINAGSPVRGKTAAVKPFPWKIEWAGKENDGEGAFVIYLPDPGSYIDTAGITQGAVEDAIDDLDDCEERDEPWKLVDCIGESGGTVYLKLHKDSSSSGSTTYAAELTTTKTEGETNIYIPIAEITIETDEDTDAVTRTISQYAMGVIEVSDPFGSSGGGGAEPDDRSIDDDAAGDKLELRDFQGDLSDEDQTLAEALFSDNGDTSDIVERKSVGTTDRHNEVRYRKAGRIYAAEGSGLSKTVDSYGNVVIDCEKVSVTGTDGVTKEGRKLKFVSESDSNVTVKASLDQNGVITLKIGVYYK